MDKKNLLQLKNKGSVLLLVLLAVVILLAIGGGLLNLGLHGRIQGIRMGKEIEARCAADAGLTKAVYEMNEKLKVVPWDDSNLPQTTDALLTGCDASFGYNVEGNLDGGYLVECLGESGHADKIVNATLRLRGVFDYGILMKGDITLFSGTLVDGYDSSNPSELDVPVQIATESTDEGSITLKPGAVVDGEVLVGVDGHFPPVNPPDGLADMGLINIEKTTLFFDSTDTGMYSSIYMNNDAILEITGDVVMYITGDVWLGQGCEITIKPDSSLTVYLDGDLVAGNSSGINNETEIPKSFLLYGTGEDQTFDLKAKVDWYGAIYAPNADISIKAGADIYGSFIGSEFENKAGGFIWYDAALRNVSETDIGVQFVVERWREE